MSKLCDFALLKLTFPFQFSRYFGDHFPLYHGRLLPTWGLLKIKKITKQPDKIYLRFLQSDFICYCEIDKHNLKKTADFNCCFNKKCSTEA